MDTTSIESILSGVFSRLKGVRRTTAGGGKALCPSHEDVKLSLSIGIGKEGDRVLLNCFAGCSTETVVAKIGLTMADLFVHANTNGNGHAAATETTSQEKKKRLVATYDYRDAGGVLRYQVLRYEPKSFRQRRPDRHGGWIYNLDGVEPLLFRLPELIDAPPDDWIFVPEGESDCLNCVRLGFVATTNSGGAQGQFPESFAQHFKGRRVAVLCDKDKAGEVGGQKRAAVIATTAKEVRLVTMPEGCRDKGDVSNLIESGWAREEILRLVERAPVYEPTTARPVIIENDGQHPAVAKVAWGALQRINRPERMFNFQSRLIRVEPQEENHVVELGAFELRTELCAAIDWITEKYKDTTPSLDFARLMLAGRSNPLPKLKRFASSPLYAASGRLIFKRGYDPESRIYLLNEVPVDIPDNVNADLVEAAIALVRSYLRDFPFETEADRTNAIALMILPVVREMINGCTPGHLINGSVPGAGKGLLVETMFAIHGVVPPAWPETDDDREIRKALMAFFLDATQLLYFENLTKLLRSAAIAAAITARFWTERILGGMTVATVDVMTIWVFTANNLVMSAEMVRRMLRIGLIPKTAHPELRPPSEFLHPNLREWVKENRPALLRAVLILVKNWMQAGRPEPKKAQPFGSFEEYRAVMGGILETAGFEGFLENRREAADRVDSENAPWRAFVARWWGRFADQPVLASELRNVAIAIPNFPLGRVDTAREQTRALGFALGSKRKAVFEVEIDNVTRALMIDNDTKKIQNTVAWCLSEIKQGAEA